MNVFRFNRADRCWECICVAESYSWAGLLAKTLRRAWPEDDICYGDDPHTAIRPDPVND